jgi:hypothetical protein
MSSTRGRRHEQAGDLQRLIDLLIGDEKLLLRRGYRLASRELPAFQEQSFDEFRAAEWVITLRTVLERLLTGRQPHDDEQSRLAGRRQAELGVSAAHMLRSGRLTYEVLQTRAHDLATREGFNDSVLLRFLELVNAWLDQAMVAAVEGHREAELELVRQEQQGQANLVRRILAGDVPVSELAVGGLELDPARSSYAVRARPSRTVDTAMIERYLLPEGPSASGGLVALVDGDVCGFVGRLPGAGAPVAVGVSAAGSLSELSLAFQKATRALETALAVGEPGLFDLRSLGLLPSVLSDRTTAEVLHERYVDPVERGARSRGTVILDTVEAFLDANSRLDLAAERLWVHVNTVRYRLARFEQLASCSLRETETLVEVWWALRHRRLTAPPTTRSRAAAEGVDPGGVG